MLDVCVAAITWLLFAESPANITTRSVPPLVPIDINADEISLLVLLNQQAIVNG